MQTRRKWTTLAIVSATVAIAFAPVFIPREASRWYLAAAANAYRVGEETLAEHYLARAKAWDADIMEDGDYWIAQLSKAHWESADEQLDLLERIVHTNPRWASQALEIALLLADEFDFQHSVRALKIAFHDGQPRSVEGLNLLAYYRSLAGIELEAALKDIDRAIEMQGRAPELLDTKAWVLHGLKRDLEALPIINEAVEGLSKAVGKDDSTAPPADEAPAGAGQEHGEPIGPETMWPDLTDVQKRIQAAKKRLGPQLWSLAVLRFHRLRIYEAVGAMPEARQDRQWLRAHDVPIVDQLF